MDKSSEEPIKGNAMENNQARKQPEVIDLRRSWRDAISPTHYCRVCGSLWVFDTDENTWVPLTDPEPDCCGEKTGVENIQPMTLGLMERLIIAQNNNDASMLRQHGRKPWDVVN